MPPHSSRCREMVFPADLSGTIKCDVTDRCPYLPYSTTRSGWAARLAEEGFGRELRLLMAKDREKELANAKNFRKFKAALGKILATGKNRERRDAASKQDDLLNLVALGGVVEETLADGEKEDPLLVKDLAEQAGGAEALAEMLVDADENFTTPPIVPKRNKGDKDILRYERIRDTELRPGHDLTHRPTHPACPTCFNARGPRRRRPRFPRRRPPTRSGTLIP